MRYGMAILTFVPREAPPNTRLRLPAALASLEQTGYRGPLVVVDDGSTDEQHIDFLSNLSRSVDVIRRSQNGGISLAKNTCLKTLRDLRIDIGFIAEDDISFCSGWLEQYLMAHQATGVHHFSWAWDNDPSGRMLKEKRTIHGYPIVITSRLNGVFLTFTQAVIESVGGFKVMPAAWGHEHTNWTRRIVAAGLAPDFSDISNSNVYIQLNRYCSDSAVRQCDRDQFARQNQHLAEDLSQIYYPILD